MMHDSRLKTLTNFSKGLASIDNENMLRSRSILSARELFNSNSISFFRWINARNLTKNLKSEDLFLTSWNDQIKNIYYHDYAYRDPVNKLLQSRLYLSTNGVINVNSYLNEKNIQYRPFYDFIGQNLEAKYLLTIACFSKNKLYASMTIGRPQSAGEFTEDEINIAQLLSRLMSQTYLFLELEQETNLENQPRSIQLKDNNIATVSSPGSVDRFPLTAREQQITKQLLYGHSSIKIAKHFEISKWTVKGHIKSIYDKTGATNRIELLRLLQDGESR